MVRTEGSLKREAVSEELIKEIEMKAEEEITETRAGEGTIERIGTITGEMRDKESEEMTEQREVIMEEETASETEEIEEIEVIEVIEEKEPKEEIEEIEPTEEKDKKEEIEKKE
jgi:hypothetical protein